MLFKQLYNVCENVDGKEFLDGEHIYFQPLPSLQWIILFIWP